MYNLRHAHLSVCSSVCTLVQLPSDGFLENLIQRTSTKICRDNPSLVTIRQKSQSLYTKTEVCFIVAIMVLCLGDMVSGC